MQEFHKISELTAIKVQEIPRIASTMQNPNLLAQILIGGIFLLLGLSGSIDL